MKTIQIFLAVTVLLPFIYGCQREMTQPVEPAVTYKSLAGQFPSPDAVYGVNCWWWWLNGNVTKEVITRDLEAMKSRNFHGAMIFDAGGESQDGNREVPAGPLFGSAEWLELFVFALDEAKRLGLEIGFNIQSGWNLGGPRVTSQYAAKQLTIAETNITGGAILSLTLDTPRTHQGFYRDIALLALPLKAESRTDEAITFLDYKLGFHELGGSAPDCRFLLDNSRPDPSTVGRTTFRIRKDDILDLTGQLRADGRLVWDAPNGEWALLRIGYTCTRAEVSTSSGDWQGNVIDYMSREAFDFYWEDVVEPILSAAGAHTGTTLRYMETDSWECGGMNWTDRFRDAFQSYRGYDPLCYLAVAGGYVVDDVPTTNAFLADFRKTIAQLVADRHYARFAERAHRHRMGIQPESAGPHAGPLDGITNYGHSDIVMSEFWSPSPHRPLPPNRFFLKQASSSAHIYGKRIVGAESFTTIGPHWNDELWHDQKSAFDHEICAGLNRLYFHTFTCSPTAMGLPGQEYFAGTHVNPQVTWWDDSAPFIDYLHRTQAVVQNGTFVADVLYYYGDHVPNVFPYKHADPAGVLPGYDYDVTNEEILLRLKVRNGKIVVPGGLAYEVLVLPDHGVLSLEALRKIDKLLQKGATVLGNRPEQTVSLTGGERARKTFRETVCRIWGDAPPANGMNEAERVRRSCGTRGGCIAWGFTAREWFMSRGLLPDYEILHAGPSTDFDCIHYRIAGKDVYFVSNQTATRRQIVCRFRQAGFRPELWDALTGTIREAKAFRQDKGQTSLPLTFEPYGSVLVVFNEPIAATVQGSGTRNDPDYCPLLEITGPWTVCFDPRWGAPDSIVFPALTDWTQHPDEGIRHYSGAATYRTDFSVDFTVGKPHTHYLQLEEVKDAGIAAVKVNGQDLGIVWTKPFRVDVGRHLRKDSNTLEVRVVNSWYNRVAGDELSPDRPRRTSTNIVLSKAFKNMPIRLEPSGLLGPVHLTEATWEE
jgi:hypothetical protein